MKNKRLFLLLIAFLLLFSGCATVPLREEIPSYTVNGVRYYPVVSLCEKMGVVWDYDVFTRRVNMNGQSHTVTLRAGEKLVLVDGRVVELPQPVEMYRGILVVPAAFKTNIFDSLFKQTIPSVVTVRVPTYIHKIVIDAGHGGKDPGAISRGGVKEKIITLDIAKRLKKILEEAGYEIVMTRSNDTYISLAQRVDIANRSHADLFVSIHANANRARSMNGFEVYYVSSTVNDFSRAQDAAKEIALDFDRSSVMSPSYDLKVTLWDMIYTQSRGESIALARTLCSAMEDNLNAKILGVKAARYYVLKGVALPAVLVEIAFLSNYNDEQKLKNSYYRQRVAEALAVGLGKYTEQLN